MKYIVLIIILKLSDSSFLTDASRLPTNGVTAHPRQDVSTVSQQTEDGLKEMMKQRWLKILRLARIPDSTPRKVPQYMQVLFSTIEANPSASVKVDPSSSGEQAAFAIKAFDTYYEAENLSVFFNVLLDFNSSAISRVEFVFTNQENSSTDHENAQLQYPAIKVCDVNCTSCHVAESTRRRQLDGINSVYDIYDITSSFVSWRAGMSSCEPCVAHVLVASSPFVGSQSDISSVDPLLIVYQNLDPDRKLDHRTPGQAGVARQREVRRRRGVAPTASTGATACQLYEWSLDFHLLGWDWIVAPHGFRADFCDGSCPTSLNDLDKANLTNHAFLRTVHRAILGPSLREPGRQVPAAACVPIRYSSMNILYKASNDTYILRNVIDMAATSCGCL